MSIDKQKNFDCVAATEHLHEYLDGELQPDLRAAMDRHVAGCADCTATLAQLRQIEAAHQQLDARLESPAEEYWQMLPQRVMEKVKASEKRRLLTLPKLPRLKSPIKRAEPATSQNLLYLSPALQKFLRGPAKYILPLAAVSAFCFFMIAEWRQQAKAPVMTAAAPQSAPEEGLLEKADDSKTVSIAEAPLQKTATRLQAVPPPASEKIRDTLLAVTDLRAGAGQGAGLSLQLQAPSEPAVGAAALPNVQAKDDAPKSLMASGAQPQITKADSVALESKSPPVTVSFARNEQESAAKSEEAEVLRQREAELQAPAVLLSKTAASDEKKKVSAAGRMGVSSAMRSAENVDERRYLQTRQQAQQTSDLKKREKLWRDFLKSTPDSLSRVLAIAEIARILTAASDSTTKSTELKKNIAFYREHAVTLRLQIGTAEYERELARFQRLLNFRKPQ